MIDLIGRCQNGVVQQRRIAGRRWLYSSAKSGLSERTEVLPEVIEAPIRLDTAWTGVSEIPFLSFLIFYEFGGCIPPAAVVYMDYWKLFF